MKWPFGRKKQPPKKSSEVPAAVQLDNPYRPIFGSVRSFEELARANAEGRNCSMEQNDRTVIAFSPTGSTAQVAHAIEKGMDGTAFYNMTVEGQPLRFLPGQLLVAAVPVFGGRVPSAALERIKKLRGNGAAAAAVVVYGNRAYEDALLELGTALTEAGFVVTGGAAFVARHSITPAIASGRPNREDLDAAREFGRSLAEKLDLTGPVPVYLPGNTPYRQYNGMAAKPQVGSGCRGCGLCADNCPTGAISKKDPTVTDPDKCITCMRCVHLCPSGARSLAPEVEDAMAAKLARVCEKPQKPEIYL